MLKARTAARRQARIGYVLQKHRYSPDIRADHSFEKKKRENQGRPPDEEQKAKVVYTSAYTMHAVTRTHRIVRIFRQPVVVGIVLLSV